MRFLMLGPLRINAGGQWISIPASQQRVTLTVLLIEAGHTVSTDRLIDEIWGPHPPGGALRTVQGYVFRLRRMLGGGPDGLLVTRDHGYELTANGDEVDARLFERLVRGGRQELADGRVVAAEDLLNQALALWRGPALADVPSAPAVAAEAARLDLIRLDATEERLGALLGLGRATEVVVEAQQLAQRHPLRERLREHHMQALIQCGRRNEALEVYQQTRWTMSAELGLEPSPRLRELQQTALSGQAGQPSLLNHSAPPSQSGPPGQSAQPGYSVLPDHSAQPGDSVPPDHSAQPGHSAPPDHSAQPGHSAQSGQSAQSGAQAHPGVKARPGSPKTTLGVIPAQLPADTVSFTGREADLARLDATLSSSDAVGATVVISAIDGAAGIGKTALAVRWAHLARERFPDGQLFADLRGYAAGQPVPPNALLARFLRALGAAPESIPEDLDEAAGLYRSLLAGKKVLVLLDNAHDGAQIRPLLPASPGCRVLVTSRDQLLGLVAHDGAIGFSLGVLTPAEAAELLTRLLGADRVAAEPGTAELLADLCGHLPLALRIAAAHLASRPAVSIAEYADRLSRDRLGMLRVPDDHQVSVQAAIDLSYVAIPADARRLLRLLGLVPGLDFAVAEPGPDISLAATSALAGVAPEHTIRLLDRLAAAHLVHERGDGRYAMHDLIRLYAADRCAAEESESDRAAAIDRLYHFYLSHAMAAAGQLYPEILRLPAGTANTAPASAAGRYLSATPHGNDSPGSPNGNDNASSAGGLYNPGSANGHDNLGSSGGHRPAVFDGHRQALGWLDAERPNLVAAVVFAGEHGPHPAAWKLADAMRGYFHLGLHIADWKVVARVALAAAEADEDVNAQASTHLSIAMLHGMQDRYTEAIVHYTAARNLSQQTDWLHCESAALGNLGTIYRRLGRLHEACEQFRAALAIDRRTGWRGGEATKLANLGMVSLYLGRLDDAEAYTDEAIALHRKMESPTGVARTLVTIGEIHYVRGHLAEAAETLRHALASLREIGDRAAEGYTARALAAVYRDVGRPDDAADLAGKAVLIARETADRRVEADALTLLAGLGQLAGHCPLANQELLASQYGPAIEGYQRTLTVAREIGDRYEEAQALAGLAVAFHQSGEPGTAAEHASAGLTIARAGGYRLLETRLCAVLDAIGDGIG